jgi:hypothetical protein
MDTRILKLGLEQKRGGDWSTEGFEVFIQVHPVLVNQNLHRIIAIDDGPLASVLHSADDTLHRVEIDNLFRPEFFVKRGPILQEALGLLN